MASIGRIAISGITAIAEGSQALANLNFDFSLVKVEAPPEFHDLGYSLTQNRRETAEDGTLHVTARRLGAMFESILPKTPELVRCYGLRASEIAKASTIGTPKNLGFFSKHAGIDGTSIWAGATSGTTAIQVHLLACLLARMWSGAEATAIWVELLHSRRVAIQAEFERSGTMDLRILAASRQQIDRAQLAEWDASARAWLRIADISKELQQKQLHLIIGNMEGYVNSKPDTYDNVIKAWVTGLECMEAILQCTSMVAQNGSASLALLSWHIYPNLYIVSPVTRTIHLKDHLVPQAAVLTIGLEGHGSLQNKGLHWSLPMAHLRFYGDPVQRKSTITCEGSRLSLPQFNLAVLGCVLGGWGIDEKDVEGVLEWIKTLVVVLRSLTSKLKSPFKNSWLYYLGDAAQTFLESEDLNRKVSQQLLNLGRKHFDFIGKPALPFFGLAEVDTAMRMAKDTEQKIRILRSQATLAKLPWDHAIIRYMFDEKYEEYASASLRGRRTLKRDISNDAKITSGHSRWVFSKPPQTFTEGHVSSIGDTFMGHSLDIDTSELMQSEKMQYNDKQEPGLTERWANYFAYRQEQYTEMGEDVLIAEKEPLITVHKVSKPMRVVWGELGMHPRSVWEAYEPWVGEMKHYEYWIGEEQSAAIFIRMDLAQPEIKTRLPFQELKALFDQNELQQKVLISTLGKALQSLEKPYLDSLRAFGAMNTLYKSLTQSTIDVRILNRPMASFKWFNALFCTSNAEDNTANHSGLPKESDSYDESDSDEDTVEENEIPPEYSSTTFFEESMDPTTFDEELPIKLPPSVSPETSWSDSAINSLKPRFMNTEESFSCTLMFENTFDVLPSQMRNVMAISSGNSLFIAATLLSDPAKPIQKNKIRHILGNIGRPGTALLVPPIEPRMMSLNIESWHLLNFSAWDGIERDSFQNSSLHLWFSGSTQEVDIGFSGAQDKELYILESVISLHGRGQWIADLDILKASQNQSLVYRHRSSPLIERLLQDSSGTNEYNKTLITCSKEHENNYRYEDLPLEAIENWSELLEKRSSSCIFLAKENWQARLAALVICVTQGRKVFLLSDSVCWTCILATKNIQLNLEDPIVYIF
ncbi:hypothetical protein GGI42DRAFT_325954 [Trichoderma sp. SZMC 28013]